MGKHDRLIAFLEREVVALRHRIQGLTQDEPPRVAPPGSAEPPPDQRIAEAKARLAEIEGHLRELKAANEPQWRPRVAGEAD